MSQGVLSNEGQSEQYSLAKIPGIWALAAVPMGVLVWVVFSLLAPDFGSDPLGAHVARLVLITLGLVIRPVHDHRSLGRKAICAGRR